MRLNVLSTSPSCGMMLLSGRDEHRMASNAAETMASRQTSLHMAHGFQCGGEH